MADITRLSGLEFINEPGTNEPGFYVPNMTTEDIQKIPSALLKFGGIVFDTTTEELLTYTAAGFWLPILTAESDLNVANLEVTGTATIATADVDNLNVTGTTTVATANITTVNAGNANFNTSDIGVASSSTLNAGVIKTTMLSGNCPVSGISPLTVSLDVGAGTGATSLIKGSVMSGTFQLNTGTSPIAGGVIGTFTIPPALMSEFEGDYGVTFMPASLVTSSVPVYITTASPSNLFIFVSGLAGLANNTIYLWNYHIIGSKKT